MPFNFDTRPATCMKDRAPPNRCATVPVFSRRPRDSVQLYFCVYKKGSSRFMLRDMEDHTAKQRSVRSCLPLPPPLAALAWGESRRCRRESS
jgi:hypothetical protein